MYAKNNDKKLTIRLSSEDLNYLEELATANKKSISEITRLLIKAIRLKDKQEGTKCQS